MVIDLSETLAASTSIGRAGKMSKVTYRVVQMNNVTNGSFGTNFIKVFLVRFLCTIVNVWITNKNFESQLYW
jgi:hypothetical protein